MKLPQTQNAFAELAANSKFGPGMHTEQYLRTGMFGTAIGQQAFDPQKHSPGDIMPFSFMEEVTGLPQVEQVLPARPLAMNVVVDYRIQRGSPQMAAYKRYLSFEIANAVDEAMPSVTDRVYTYHIGKPPEDTMYTGEAIDGDEERQVQEITELCSSGLTLVISDFRHLSFGQQDDLLSPMVAVKTNHPAEIAIPANKGVLPLGRGVEVNTNNSAELEYVNSSLLEEHRTIIAGLERVGASVATAIFNPQLLEGFDTDRVDGSLARAIDAYAKN